MLSGYFNTSCKIDQPLIEVTIKNCLVHANILHGYNIRWNSVLAQARGKCIRTSKDKSEISESDIE